MSPSNDGTGSAPPAKIRFREHVNTLLLQRVLDDPAWAARLGADDQRGLTPLFWSNINPYGKFSLDMDSRLDLSTAPGGVP